MFAPGTIDGGWNPWQGMTSMAGAQAPATGAASNAPGWLQNLLSGGQFNANPSYASSPFMQQLKMAGGYTNAPQAPGPQPQWAGQPGVNPALAGILNNLPARPTGLQPGMLGYAPGVIDTPKGLLQPAPAPVRPGLLTNPYMNLRDHSGRRGDTGGRAGWGGPADHADRADHMGGGHTNGQDKAAAGRDAARN